MYVPSPPPATAPSQEQSTETLVIEEPAPPPEPQQEETAPEVSAAPRPAPKPPRPARSAPDNIETPPEPAPPAEVPALEPRESHAKESELRRQIIDLQIGVRQRIAHLEQIKLGAPEGKTLEDARTFLAQSQKASEQTDLQRALTLARKASLLLSTLELQK